MPKDDRTRNDTGQFTSDTIYSEKDFLTAIADLDDPTTTDIARLIGCSPATAHNWLHQLATDGRVESREIGNSLVWERIS